jgi:spore coat protein U-like protein
LIGIDIEKTKRCVQDAFSLNGKTLDFNVHEDIDNEQLNSQNLTISCIETEAKYYNKYGPPLFPAVVINN